MRGHTVNRHLNITLPVSTCIYMYLSVPYPKLICTLHVRSLECPGTYLPSLEFPGTCVPNLEYPGTYVPSLECPGTCVYLNLVVPYVSLISPNPYEHSLTNIRKCTL